MLEVKVLGERIKALRKARGMTQSEFAKALCVSFQAVSNWERGIAPPDLDNLMRVASFFGVLIDELVKGPKEALSLGIDGGGTKTEFVVCDTDGKVLMEFTKKGCNPNDITYENMIALLKDGIHEARRGFPSITNVFCGISGVMAGNYRERTYGDLKAEYPSLRFSVESDSHCIFGMDDQAEIAMISGTGSSVFVKKGESVKLLGGWGYLFDYAGSAYDMGRDAVIESLTEENEQKEPSLLHRLLLEKLETRTVSEAISLLYREGKSKIASLSVVVIQAYCRGDVTAQRIVLKTAARLADLLNLATQKYGAKPFAVASGGLIKHNREILLPLIKKYTNVCISIPDVPPVYGACHNAVKLSGKVGKNFYDNFKNSYRG